MNSPDRGVIYVATGEPHVAAARASAVSVRRTNPQLGRVLFADADTPFEEFDRVEQIPNPHKRSKVDMLRHSPFSETLFLDTDTRVVGNLEPAFKLLERYDLAVAHRAPDPKRLFRSEHEGGLPSAYPEHNSGVMLYRRTDSVWSFLDGWSAAYHQLGRTADQVSLREQLWKSDIRLVTLPARYNTRKYDWLDHWFWRGPPPVILHANRFHPIKTGSGLTGALRRWSGPAPEWVEARTAEHGRDPSL